MNAAVVIWLYSFAYLGSCLFVYISATWYLPIFQHFGALLLYSFAYLDSCLFVLNLFHQVEFAAVFVPGKRNANPSNYQVTTTSSNHIP